MKLDGRKLTEGWKEFVKAHDLRIGDIIIFRHEGDMVFNVTPFGPSCCEIQYVQSHIKKEDNNDEDDDEDEMENQHNTSEFEFLFFINCLNPRSRKEDYICGNYFEIKQLELFL